MVCGNMSIRVTLFSQQYLVDVLYTKMLLDGIFLLRGVFCQMFVCHTLQTVTLFLDDTCVQNFLQLHLRD